jgi:hypothetical protein
VALQLAPGLLRWAPVACPGSRVHPSFHPPPCQATRAQTGSYTACSRSDLDPASGGQEMPTAGHLQLTLRSPALPAALRLPPPAMPGSCSSVWTDVDPSGASKPGMSISCRRANQARQAEWLLLALLCQNCSMLARISKQARYTSKLALCTASDCRETSWQFQLPWEIRSGSSRAHRAKQSTQREGELTMLLACLQKSTWTSCKVIPCILQHKQPHRSVVHGCSTGSRRRWGHGLAQAMVQAKDYR